jgi:uncharacterized repeat protein (TIGR01451 family)
MQYQAASPRSSVAFRTVFATVAVALFVFGLLAAPAWAQTTTLSINKTDTPDPVRVGEELTYTITVRNTGSAEDAENVRLEDVLPTNATFVSATTADGNCTEPAVGATGGTVRCNLGDIAPGATDAVEIQVKPTVAAGEAGFVDNTASAEGSNTNRARDTERTRVEESGITIEKDDSPDPADVGESLLYKLEADNDTSLSQDVNVVDELPDDVEFISVDTNRGSCSESSNVVRCRIDNLAPGDTATVRIFVEPLEDGTITNTAQVFARGDRFTPIAEARERTRVENREPAPAPTPTPTPTPTAETTTAEATTSATGAEATTSDTAANAADAGDVRDADAFRCEFFLRVVRDDRGALRHQYHDDELIVQRFEQCISADVLTDTIPNRLLPGTGGLPLIGLAALGLASIVAGASVLGAGIRRGR